MKRTILKRTAFRRTFRSWDENEIRKAWAEDRRKYTEMIAQLGVPTERERAVMVEDSTVNPVKQVGLSMEPPANRGNTHAERSAERRARGKHKSRYARRDRAWDYMEFVKGLPCLLTHVGGCWVVVEADHAGDRGLGQKSLDAECIPLCTGHHKERTDLVGYFANYSSAEMREWRHAAVAATQEQARRAGVEIPLC